MSPPSRRDRGVNAWLATLLVAVLLGMLNYLAARHYRRGDWTRARMFSISEKTANVLRALDKDVRATVFMFRGSDGEAGQLRADVDELLERFRRYTKRLKVEMIDPDRDPQRVQLLAKQYEIKQDDLDMGGVVVFASGKKHKYVTRDDIAEYDFGGETGEDRKLKAFKGEAAFLGALTTVTEESQSLLCFTAGHGEAAIDAFEELGLSSLDEELKRDNYKTRKLEDGALGKPIPGECAAVVVAGPQRAFAQPEIETIDTYLRGGGRVLLLLGPVLDSNVERFLDTGMEELAARWGIHVGANVVVDDAAVPGHYRYITWLTSEGFGAHPIGEAMKGKAVIFTLPREVRAKGAQGLDARDVVRSSDKGWGETSFGFLRGESELRFDAATDVKGPVPIAAAAEKSETGARLVVIGTADFVSNAQLRGAVRDYSRDFALGSVAWLLQKEARVAVGPKEPEHFKLALTDAQLGTVFLVVFVAMPLVALGGGVAVWWRRRQ